MLQVNEKSPASSPMMIHSTYPWYSSNDQKNVYYQMLLQSVCTKCRVQTAHGWCWTVVSRLDRQIFLWRGNWDKNELNRVSCHWTINDILLNHTSFYRTVFFMSLDRTSFYWIIRHSIRSYTSCHWIGLHFIGSYVYLSDHISCHWIGLRVTATHHSVRKPHSCYWI